MGKATISIEEAGLKYGSEGIISYIQKGKNLNSKQTEILIKELQRHYQNVTVSGRGKKRFFILEQPYEIAQPKYDGRKENGDKFPFLETVKELIIHYLKDNEKFAENEFYAITRFLQELEMIDPKFRRAYSYEKDLLCYKKQLIRDKILTEENSDFAKYYVNDEQKRLSRVVKKALRELEDEGLIMTNEVTQGFGYETRYKLNKMKQISMVNDVPDVKVVPKHFILDQEQAKEIAEIEKNLRNEYNVTTQEIFRYKNKKEVVRYNQAKKKAFEKFGIKYHYKAITAYIIGSEKEIEQYRQRDKEIVIWDFISEYKRYSLEKAKDREDEANKNVIVFGEGQPATKKLIEKMKLERNYSPTWDNLQDSLLQGRGLKNYEEMNEQEQILLGLKKTEDDEDFPDF